MTAKPPHRLRYGSIRVSEWHAELTSNQGIFGGIIMKISNDESVRAAQIAPAQPPVSLSSLHQHKAGHKEVPTDTPAVHVEISAQAQALSASKAEAAHYLPAVQAAPETRDALVTSLKAQVEGGTYHVKGADIAEQILRRSAADRLQ